MNWLMIHFGIWRIRALTEKAERLLDRRDWWRRVLARIEGAPPDR